MKEKEIGSTRIKRYIGKRNTVVKMFGTSYSKADILNEALNHARVEEHRIKDSTTFRSIYCGRKMVDYNGVDYGRTMQEVMDENPKDFLN